MCNKILHRTQIHQITQVQPSPYYKHIKVIPLKARTPNFNINTLYHNFHLVTK